MIRLEKRGKPSTLVMMYATWCLLGTWRFRMTPSCILSLTKWQSISMCFVLSWNTRLAAIWIAAWLSENNKASFVWGIPRSWSKDFSQMTSHTTNAMALYSASTKDLDTVVCFFDLHDTKECPRKIYYPVVDLWVSGHLAQSEFEKALMCNSDLDG